MKQENVRFRQTTTEQEVRLRADSQQWGDYLREAQEPLLQELAAVGWEVKSVWDLVNTAERYPEAVPVLLRHLPRPYHRRIREGIARALTVPEARGVACPVILQELKRSQGGDECEFRWCLLNALTVVADRSIRSEVEGLLSEPKLACEPADRMLIERVLRGLSPEKKRALAKSPYDPYAKIEADPEWASKHEVRESRWRQIEEQLRREQKPLLQELAAAGREVKSVWDLVYTLEPYPEAVPMLLRHLPQSYHLRIREGIARALTVPEARGRAAWDILREIKASHGNEEKEFRWTLINALTVVADGSMLSEIQSLTDDERFKENQVFLHRILKRISPKRPARAPRHK